MRIKRYQLFDDESILYLFADASVLVTDKRIRKMSAPGETIGLISILLENISAIEVRYNANNWLLVLGVALAVLSVGVLRDYDALGLLGLGISAILFIYYYESRERVIEFKSPTDVIRLPIRFLNEERVEHLINKIEYVRMRNRR